MSVTKMNEEIKPYEVPTPLAPTGASQTYSVNMDTLFNLAANMRYNINHSIGNIMFQVEAALGDSTQSNALKQLIKQELWELCDENQRQMYATFENHETAKTKAGASKLN